MGKLNLLDIVIHNGQSIFYPGQFVQGEVICDVKDDLKLRDISLLFHGYGDVHWSERHTSGSGKNRRTTTRHYRNHETYINNKLILLAPGPNEDNLVLKPGRYQYPFNFQLPNPAPASFEGSIGRVRYYIKVNIDRPWAFDEHKELPFTVIHLLDLNQEQTASHPAQNEGNKTLCCLCCQSGPITGKIAIDKTGYVPGEAIPIKAECINNSRRTMSSSKISLNMAITYRARAKSRTICNVVACLQKGEIQEGDSETWYGEKLVVPPLPCSGLVGCNIIDIQYYVILTITPSGPAFSLEVPVNVIIGGIPLTSTIQQYGIPQSSPGTNYGNFPEPPSAFYPTDLPAPTYSRSILGPMQGGYGESEEAPTPEVPPQNSVGPQEENKWSPMYTYYNWNQTDPNFQVTST